MSMAMRMGRLAVISVLATGIVGVPVTSRAQSLETPTFRTAVDLVPVSAIVKDESRAAGPRPRSSRFPGARAGAPAPHRRLQGHRPGTRRLAILMDVSRSMHVAGRLEASRRAVEHLLSWVDPQKDELSLFSFDKDLREEVGFTRDLERIRAGLLRIDAMGLTSLYDAIGKTARTLADRPSPRRAVVVLTDGTDTSSRLTPSEVSTLASAIDVPVYVIAVLSPLDHPGTPTRSRAPINRPWRPNWRRWRTGRAATC